MRKKAPAGKRGWNVSIADQMAGLEHLYQTAPVGLCLLDLDLRFLRINERLAEINGKSVEEHLGKTLREILPEIAEEVEPVFQRVIDTGKPILGLDVRGVTPAQPNIERRWLVSHYPLKSPDGKVTTVSSVVQEVTDIRKAEQTLKESEEKYRVTAEAATDAIIMISQDSTILYANPATETIFGYPIDQLIGRSLTILMPKGLRSRHVASLSKFVSSGKKRVSWGGIELTAIHRKGHKFPIEVSFGTFRKENGQYIFTGIVRDITSRKRSEHLQTGQKRVLELLARGKPLSEVLNQLAQTVDKQGFGNTCSILILDEDGKGITSVVGPGLPDEYKKALEKNGDGISTFGCVCAENLDHGVIISDLTKSPRTTNLCKIALRVGIRACWSQPILAQTGQVLGTFVMYYDQPHNPDKNEMELIEQAAYIAGVAIERVRANTALGRSEAALRKSHVELQDLAGRLISAHEEQRQKVARELHDDFTQRLAALAIEAGRMEKKSNNSADPEWKNLGNIRREIIRLAEDLQNVSRQLHPSILDDLGLVDAVTAELARFSKQEGIQIKFTPRNVPRTVHKEISLCLYRVTQESLRNIAKHSQAKKVHISLSGKNTGIHLSIRDFGVGFVPLDVKGRAGLGLASMKERVRLAKGSFSLESRPGKGTIIRVKIPVTQSAIPKVIRSGSRPSRDSFPRPGPEA